jgi:hypothetical protein
MAKGRDNDATSASMVKTGPPWGDFTAYSIPVESDYAPGLQGELWMPITEVASVSPGRMFGNGMAHLLIGLTWSLGPIVGLVADTEEVMIARPAVIAIVVLLWPLGIPIFLRGVGLLQQSFGDTGHFRADTEGIELRLGGPSLYTRLIGMIPQIRVLPANPDTFAIRFPEDGVRQDGGSYVYRFRWNKIAAFDVSLFAFVIELRSGARLLLRRFYFVEGPVTIGRRLNEITARLRATNPLPNE